MEKKWYYVELAYVKNGLYYEVELLTFEKMQEYFIDLAEINPKMMGKINFNEPEVQRIYCKVFQKPEAYNVIGNIYLAYAVSEEETLGKVIKTGWLI